MEITIIPPESKNKSKVILDESSVERDRRATAEDIYNAEKIRFGFKSIRYFNTTYWILCVVFLFLANCYYQYTNIATEILEHRFGYTFEEANKLTIIPEAAFIVVSPFVSKWVEVKGKKPLWLLVAAVIFLGNYSYMYFMKVEKTLVLYLNFTAIGFGYSITTCALFSSVALSIPKAGVSMGYSILTLIENIGLSLLPLYFGEISEDRSVESYNQCLLALVVLSILGTIFCLLLLLYDTKNSNLLTLPENSKKVRKLRKGIDSDFLEKSVRGNTSVSFKQPDESNGTESFFVAGLPKKRDKRALSTVA
jgi:MFS family permease